ncbi:phage antirepressor N-terminal domain-containing protein [uncultured Gilliamella sp.]|uniref:phage antirepressor N-terminal domain-containing protein n=1 Tax=uncultured Gilliamella sp. TaxID=1193505 RepID=UPI003457F706
MVQFHNQSLIVLNYQDKPYIVMKPVCENIGLDWHAQLNRINRHNILSKAVVMIATSTNGGVQKSVCLPISMINGWLFGIETSRVKLEIRATIQEYLTFIIIV